MRINVKEMSNSVNRSNNGSLSRGKLLVSLVQQDVQCENVVETTSNDSSPPPSLTELQAVDPMLINDILNEDKTSDDFILESSCDGLIAPELSNSLENIYKFPFGKLSGQQDDGYQPTQLSPTMQLAKQMGASAQKVQRMKATFYSDELDDYPINGDFLDYGMGPMVDVEEFDQGHKLHKSFPLFRTQFDKYEDTPSPMSFQPVDVETESSEVAPSIEMPQAPPVLSVRPQHKTLQCPDNGVISFSQSIAAKACYAMDLSLWKGHSFRVGWGRDSTLVSLSTHNVARTVEWYLPLTQLSTVLDGRQQSDHSPPIVQRIGILPGHTDNSVDFENTIEGHLQTALDHSLLSQAEEHGCPLVAPKAGVEALHAHCALAQQLALNDSHPSLITAHQVWELGVALWGNLPDLEPHELPSSHHSVMVRRQAVSDWLENVVKPQLKQEMTQDTDSPGNIFSLLTGHCVLEACNQAHNAGDEYAALLLSQLSVGSVKLMLQQQLTQWVDTEADKLIDTDRLKLMMLVAGKPLLPTSDRVVNLCDGLDWRRAFAVHLWYICSSVSSVTDALLRYEAAFSDDEQPYASPPQPTYLVGDVEWETSAGCVIYDVCYHMLKLFSSRSHPLAPLLNPATHSADPLDYRLSWLLLRTVEALGYSHISALSAANIHTMFAAQLEAHGMWHWAVFALMHIPDTQSRTKAVTDMLGRHVDLYTEPEREQFLIHKLKVPAQWVYEAKATYATAHFQHRDAAEFLLKAAQWNEAHKVIMEHIAPRAIINDKYDYLSGLLKQLSSHQQRISNWGQQGAMLLDYLSIVAQVNDLVSKRDPSIGYHLEGLQPQLRAVCSRINLLPTPTTIHRLCQVEIAKRALHMIRTLLLLQRGDTSQSLTLLATLTNQLPLPEDYNKQEILELITNTVANLVR